MHAREIRESLGTLCRHRTDLVVHNGVNLLVLLALRGGLQARRDGSHGAQADRLRLATHHEVTQETSRRASEHSTSHLLAVAQWAPDHLQELRTAGEEHSRVCRQHSTWSEHSTQRYQQRVELILTQHISDPATHH